MQCGDMESAICRWRIPYDLCTSFSTTSGNRGRLPDLHRANGSIEKVSWCASNRESSM